MLSRSGPSGAPSDSSGPTRTSIGFSSRGDAGLGTFVGEGRGCDGERRCHVHGAHQMFPAPGVYELLTTEFATSVEHWTTPLNIASPLFTLRMPPVTVVVGELTVHDELAVIVALRHVTLEVAGRRVDRSRRRCRSPSR